MSRRKAQLSHFTKLVADWPHAVKAIDDLVAAGVREVELEQFVLNVLRASLVLRDPGSARSEVEERRRRLRALADHAEELGEEDASWIAGMAGLKLEALEQELANGRSRLNRAEAAEVRRVAAGAIRVAEQIEKLNAGSFKHDTMGAIRRSLAELDLFETKLLTGRKHDDLTLFHRLFHELPGLLTAYASFVEFAVEKDRAAPIRMKDDQTGIRLACLQLVEYVRARTRRPHYRECSALCEFALDAFELSESSAERMSPGHLRLLGTRYPDLKSAAHGFVVTLLKQTGGPVL